MINHVRVTSVARQRLQENPSLIKVPPRGFEPGSLAELGTNGLIRDQRYRTDHDAGMPMPD